jgi:hypothetical protein
LLPVVFSVFSSMLSDTWETLNSEGWYPVHICNNNGILKQSKLCSQFCYWQGISGHDLGLFFIVP